MSLFGDLEGQPDVWSLNGITFACAVNDILEKEVFTLQELLEEDELLQEVKSRNTALIDFLSREETVSQLVGYLTETPDDKDTNDDLRKFKYPYISCEVFCCEVPDILATLVESDDNKLLNKLFSLLDSELPLNPHLGGYFEKILEMLFRRMTIPVIPFVNQGGINLLRRFLDQIDNYSVMQIVQRLMLPHIPFLMTIDPNDMMMDDRQNYQCNWSSIPEACDMLCDRMLDLQHVDVPSHVSDLLITVLQLSPPDASILYHLCNPACLKKLFAAAFADNADHDCVTAPPSALASVSLAALSVLESLVSRICEAMVPPGIDNSFMLDEGNQDGGNSGYSEAAERDTIERDIDIQILYQLKTSIINICAALAPHLPTVNRQLQDYLVSSPCGRVATQTKSSLPRLGHRGLLMVKLIESTIRLGDSNIDKLLCDTGVLSSSVELVFAFKFNSLLHLTVQRIVLMVVEGGAVRRSVQNSLLFEHGFLRRLMKELRRSSEVTPEDVKDVNIDVTAEIQKVEQKAREREEEKGLLAGSRCPLLGHLVQIAQAIGTSYLGEEIDRLAEPSRVVDDSEAHLVGDFDSGSCTPPALSSTQSVDTLSIALLKALSDFSSTQEDVKVPGSPTSASAGPTVRIEGAVGDDQTPPPAHVDSAKATDQSQRSGTVGGEGKAENSSSSFRSLFAESAMEAEWELFESEILRDITDSQFAFQVTLERIEDNFGPMSLMHGSNSSYDAFGSNRQGAEGNGDRSMWKHLSQMRIGGMDESNRQFSLEQDDDDDDDDDDDEDEMDHHMASHYMYSNHFGQDSSGSADFASFDDFSFPIQNGYNFSSHSEPKIDDDFADFGAAAFESATIPESTESRSPRGNDSAAAFDDFDFDTLNLHTDT